MRKTRIKILTLAAVILGVFVIVITLGMGGNAAEASPLLQLTPFPTPTPGADGRILYVVQADDTLWRIAAITGVSLDQLRTLNKLGPDDIISPGDVLLIGLAGPESVTPTPGPLPTGESIEPTITARAGTGNLCVLLYDDVNGDAIRQEEEVWIQDGQISIANRSGSVSETVETELIYDEDGEIAYYCFEDLAEAEFNVSIAIPDGYNPTTILNRTITLRGGEETYLSFGAQENSEKIADSNIIPEAPRKSPLLAIAGGLLLVVGIVLGLYAGLISRLR